MIEHTENKLPSVFFSYSHADEVLRDQLEKQLSMLKRQGAIETWHDRRISAGANIHTAIDDHINSDEIILLLVSPDFIDSDYCYDIEMKRAMERHHAGEAIVIPVILRACDWHGAPFGKLNATPRDGKPIKQWPDIDDAFLQVAKAVREAAERIGKQVAPIKEMASTLLPSLSSQSEMPSGSGPRSSNLRIAKSFTQRDKDKFHIETFGYIARFFENSLAELGHRNPGFEGDYRLIDANRFFATIYKNGNDVARCTVFLSTSFGSGICYVGQLTESNTMNEILHIEVGEQALYLAPGMGVLNRTNTLGSKLSQEGAAELYWNMLIGPLQGKGF